MSKLGKITAYHFGSSCARGYTFPLCALLSFFFFFNEDNQFINISKDF